MSGDANTERGVITGRRLDETRQILVRHQVALQLLHRDRAPRLRSLPAAAAPLCAKPLPTSVTRQRAGTSINMSPERLFSSNSLGSCCPAPRGEITFSTTVAAVVAVPRARTELCNISASSLEGVLRRCTLRTDSVWSRAWIRRRTRACCIEARESVTYGRRSTGRRRSTVQRCGPWGLRSSEAFW
jgi:hypothetical protein